jgi:hypothetical protein
LLQHFRSGNCVRMSCEPGRILKERIFHAFNMHNIL